MKISQFQAEIAKVEGKKVQVSVGNVREVLSLIRKKIKDATGTDIYSIIRKI